MAMTVWKGSITFGLVSIPIRLYAAARPRRIPLHQLHNKCHTRLKQPLFCPTCNRFVERSEVVKGFEYEKGQSIAAAPEAPRAPVIDIMQALKKSLAASNKKEEARPEMSRPAPAAVARRQRRKAG
jgi:DNA end-binding protein Ku